MKQLLVLLSFFGISLAGTAQTNSWKIKLHKKLILSTGVESETKNVRKVKADDWKKTGFLEINFTEADPNPEWYRSYIFTDKDDAELLRIDSVTNPKIALTQLRQLFRTKTQIRILTLITPRDPNVAMTVRLRRVHLCTLQIQ
jgi:hypothetical protein